jgi:Na+-driven multidrug efflux pump
MLTGDESLPFDELNLKQSMLDPRSARLIDELSVLEKGASLWQKIRLFLKLVIPSVTIAISHSGSSFLNTLGFFIANKTGTEFDITTFGLSIFMSIIAVYNLSQPVIEKMTICSAVSFSSQKFDKMKSHFVTGLLVFFFYTVLLFVPVCYFSDKILLRFGIEPPIAQRTSEILFSLLPLELVRLHCEYLIAYMISQGVETGYGLLALATLSVGMPVSYYCGVVLGMGIRGWFFGKMALEFTKLSILLVIYCARINNKGFKVEHLKAGFTEIRAFMKDVLVFTAGYYCEAVGYEISTFFVILLKDPKQLGAYTILNNLLYINENIGYGFGQTIRTRINYLIGIKKHDQAKSFFKLAMVGLLAFSPLVGMLYYFLRDYIVEFYAGNSPAIGAYLTQLVTIQGATCFSILFLMPIFMASRSTNQAVLNLALDLFVIVGLQTAASTLLVTYWKPSCAHLLLVINACFSLANLLVCVKLFIMDWKKECSPVTESKSMPLLAD